jgi:hypothetical protein
MQLSELAAIAPGRIDSAFQWSTSCPDRLPSVVGSNDRFRQISNVQSKGPELALSRRQQFRLTTLSPLTRFPIADADGRGRGSRQPLRRTTIVARVGVTSNGSGSLNKHSAVLGAGRLMNQQRVRRVG